MTTIGSFCVESQTGCPVSLTDGTHSSSWQARFQRVLQRLLHWQDRARQRRQLAGLDDRALRDIGLDRASAHFEASKPFWRG